MSDAPVEPDDEEPQVEDLTPDDESADDVTGGATATTLK